MATNVQLDAVGVCVDIYFVNAKNNNNNNKSWATLTFLLYHKTKGMNEVKLFVNQTNVENSLTIMDSSNPSSQLNISQ